MRKAYLLTGLFYLLCLQTPFAQTCSTTDATACSCAQSGTTNCDLLPDLIVGKPPLLATGNNGVIEYSQSGNGVENGRLRVSVSTPNLGFGPLEIQAQPIFICGTDTFFGTSPGTCPGTGAQPKQLIIQRVYHKNGTVMTSYERPAGSMTYHPAHGHMHVDDWGIYTLRTATADPNPLNWPIVGTGAKLAFCLMDYGNCTGYAGHCVDSLGNTMLNGNFPNYGLGGGVYNCSPVVQGISSGYTDIYYQYLDGMYIAVPPGTCNGSYYIVVQLDPYNYFLESNENNNVLAIPFTLTQQSGSPPSITAGGPTIFCPGGSVTLTASSGTSYLWSTGATTQSIVASTTGSYTVNVTGGCNGTTPPTDVVVNTVPVTASATNSSVCSGGSTQLNSNATTTAYTTTGVNFSNNNVISIPDNFVNGVSSPVVVSGINPSTILSSSLVQVTVNISHTYDSHLILYLVSPSGNQVILSKNRGGSSNNYTNTIFRMNAATAIGSGVAPFTGSFKPDGNFNAFTGNINGTWQLRVADIVTTEVGTINSWTLRLNTQTPDTITYSWSSNPAGFSSTLKNPFVSPGANTTYMVTATDIATGCTGTGTVAVSISQPPTATASSNSPVCVNSNIQLNLVTNGTGFSWTGPNGFTSLLANPVINNAPMAASGTYTVTVTSAGGCTSTATVSVSVVNTLSLSAVINNVSCNGGTNGSINLTVTNGVSPVFSWSNGSTTEDLAGLASGNYQVTVTSGSCSASGNYPVTQPAQLSCICNATITNVSCHGGSNGSVTAQVSGGTSPYSYLWNNGQTTLSATSLSAGTYTLTITDASGCTVTGNAQVTQPSAISTSAVITQLSCQGSNNGIIDLTPTGGTPPYTYLWSNGSTNQDISGLAKATYTITVTDICGVSYSRSYFVNQKTNPFALTLSKSNLVCAGASSGTASAAPSNGIQPYAYSWNTVPVKTTASITGLPTGTYTVTVTDGSGCTRSGSVTIYHPPYITAVVTQTNVSFPGGNNGSASLAVAGGVGPYTYSWNTVPVLTTSSITGLTAGVYKCNIRDTKLCLKKVTVIITEPSSAIKTKNKIQSRSDAPGYISISPNPADGIAQLTFRADSKGEARLMIGDMIGNIVYRETMAQVNGLNRKQLDLRTLPRGVYFTWVESKNRTKVIKLILQ